MFILVDFQQVDFNIGAILSESVLMVLESRLLPNTKRGYFPIPTISQLGGNFQTKSFEARSHS
jgi:hypothetical protein